MYAFIVNPIAGNGRAKRYFSKIMDSELYRDIDSEYFITKYKGHAEIIARELIEKKGNKLISIIVISGDGTLHEVINGIGNHAIPITFIPGGSGNDFARGCTITGKPLDILHRAIYGEHVKSYWLGNYKADKHPTRIFTNNIGFGFDAEIARTVNKSKYKKYLNILRIGRLSYVIGLIQVLFRFKPIEIDLEVDKNKYTFKNCWMVTITNHPYYGGGMKIIPNAKIQPTTFPVMVIHSISKWKILGLFMTVFSGKHINFKEVELMEAKKLTIRAKEKIPVQIDGETSTCYSSVISKQSNCIHVQGTNMQQLIKKAE